MNINSRDLLIGGDLHGCYVSIGVLLVMHVSPAIPVVRFNLFHQLDVLAYDFEGGKMSAAHPLDVKHCSTVAELA